MPDTPDEANAVNTEILEALLGDEHQGAVKSGEPPRLREVVSKGEDEFSPPMVARVYQDAGVHPIYDIRSGERSLTPVNLLPAQLKKLGPDGHRMFTTRPPAEPPARGTYKCLLHADERRPEYDQWGLPVCRKANLLSPLQVEMHMAHRHRMEWQTIQREQEKVEKAEAMRLQRQIAEAAVRQNPDPELVGASKKK